MGADFYFNPLGVDEELWEKVRAQGDALRQEKRESERLRVVLADRNAEIAALKQALVSLGRTDPIKFTR